MLPWTDSAWLETVHAWIGGQTARLGLAPRGLEQTHVQPWSTVIRVPTDGGVLWFKANRPTDVHEAAVVNVLAERCPAAVPALLAVDLERGWMLMRDGGTRLREVLAAAGSVHRWLDVLPVYAGLQIAVMDDADALAAVGAPRRRLDALPAEYEDVIERLELPADELRRFRALAPRVRELCDELAALGIPDSIQHDDLHDAQIYVDPADEGLRILDWGDACVSHPFFSMSVTLEGVIAWGVDDVQGSVDVAPYAAAYLEPFAGFGSLAELREALRVALRLGWICRVVNLHRSAGGGTDYALDGLRLRMRLFADGLDR